MGLLCLPRLNRLNRQTVLAEPLLVWRWATNLTFVWGAGTSISRAGVINNSLYVHSTHRASCLERPDRRINLVGIGLASLG